MNKKILKLIGIILLILIVGFVIWKIVSYEEKTFNKFDFDTNHKIFNTTEINYLDSITHAGIQSVGIYDIIIVIKPLKNKNNLVIPDDIDIKAYIVGDGKQYIIYIDKMSRKQYIKVLSHELIHLQQYYNGKLIVKKDTIYWNNKLVDINSYEYKDRPWEKEAFDNQHDLENKMLKILY